MGDLFDQPKLVNRSSVNKDQQSLFGPLRDILLQRLTETGGASKIESLFSGGENPFLRDFSQRIFQDSIIGPANRNFQQNTRPAIAAGFANIGGTLSSRRGKAISDAATDSHIQSQAALSALLPTLLGTQLQGLQTADQLRQLPIQNALQFALTSTQQTAQTPAGMGWGLLGDILGAAASVGTAGLLG